MVMEDIFDTSPDAPASPFVTTNDVGVVALHTVVDESITIQPVPELSVEFSVLEGYQDDWDELHQGDVAFDPSLTPYQVPSPKRIVPLDAGRNFVTIKDYVLQLHEWAEENKEDVILACCAGRSDRASQARNLPFWVWFNLPEDFYIESEYDDAEPMEKRWGNLLREIRREMDLDRSQGLVE